MNYVFWLIEPRAGSYLVLWSFSMAFAGNFADKLGSWVKVFIIVNVKFFLFASNHLLGNVRVSSLETENNWFREGVLLVSFNDWSSKSVTSQNTTENVNKDGLDFWIFVQQLHGNNQSLTFGWATNIQEVSWFTSVHVNDVHSAHSKTGTIDKTSDVASDVNVVKIVLLGKGLFSIVLSLILLLSEFLLSVKSIAVNCDLTVSAHDHTLLCKHEWVNFNHVAIFLVKALVHILKELHNLICLVFESEVNGSLLKILDL